MFDPYKKLLFSTFSSVSMAAFLVQPGFCSDEYDKALNFYKTGSYKQALATFDSVRRSEPSNSNVLYFMGLCNQRLGNAEDARKFYSSLVRQHPDSAAAIRARQALGLPVLQTRTRSSALPEFESVPFTRDKNGLVIVTCKVNGKDQQFVFDTGADSVIISRSQLQNLGLSAPTGEPSGLTSGVAGKVKTWRMPADISLGRIDRRLNLTVIENHRMLPLLGHAFFGGYKCHIDNATQTIRFVRPGSKSQEPLVANDTISLPISRWGSEILVDATINGSPLKMIFDTGAQMTSFPSRVVQTMLRTGGWQRDGVARANGVGGGKRVDLYNVNRLELGPVCKSNMRVGVLDIDFDYGILGQDFFGERKCSIDYDRNLLLLSR